MIREDLKPCPLCGGKAYMWQTNYHTYIQCDNFNTSDAEGHLIQVSANTEAEAVRRWESRWEQKKRYFRLVRRETQKGEADNGEINADKGNQG